MSDPLDTRSNTELARHRKARALLTRYNATPPENSAERHQLLTELLASLGKGAWLEPPFFCDYGDNIHIGEGVFANFNLTILDGAEVRIGAGTLLGPSVQIYATTHPLSASERIFEKDGLPAYRSSAAPVTIGARCWIGGGAIIQSGVSIGDDTTIGAGSVVTKDIPSGVLAAGAPCMVLKKL